MTYFLLSITNTCNKACTYCVVKPWLNNPEYPDKATAEDFIGFLEKETQAGDVVEITGGEPTMFPRVLEILEWLREHEAKVILRTNGLFLNHWRVNYPNMIVVLARHDSGEEYWAKRRGFLLPYDLAIDSIPDNIKQDVKGKPKFVNDEISTLSTYPFNRFFHITNDGKVRFMSCCKEDMGTIWEYKPREYMCCPNCNFALGAWNLASRIDSHGNLK